MASSPGREIELLVIVLSQLNVELRRDKNRKLWLPDLRAIEQDTDVAGLLYKPDAPEVRYAI